MLKSNLIVKALYNNSGAIKAFCSYGGFYRYDEQGEYMEENIFHVNSLEGFQSYRKTPDIFKDEIFDKAITENLFPLYGVTFSVRFNHQIIYALCIAKSKIGVYNLYRLINEVRRNGNMSFDLLLAHKQHLLIGLPCDKLYAEFEKNIDFYYTVVEKEFIDDKAVKMLYAKTLPLIDFMFGGQCEDSISSNQELCTKINSQLCKHYGQQVHKVISITIERGMYRLKTSKNITAYLVMIEFFARCKREHIEIEVEPLISEPNENLFFDYLFGISAINPLPPHYHCKHCKHTEFSAMRINHGYDLPPKQCPFCGGVMHGDGHNIKILRDDYKDGFLNIVKYCVKVNECDLNKIEKIKSELLFEIYASFSSGAQYHSTLCLESLAFQIGEYVGLNEKIIAFAERLTGVKRNSLYYGYYENANFINKTYVDGIFKKLIDKNVIDSAVEFYFDINSQDFIDNFSFGESVYLDEFKINMPIKCYHAMRIIEHSWYYCNFEKEYNMALETYMDKI